jgi:hypothetical protein
MTSLFEKIARSAANIFTGINEPLQELKLFV